MKAKPELDYPCAAKFSSGILKSPMFRSKIRLSKFSFSNYSKIQAAGNRKFDNDDFC
jgi:hypothetical protein